MNLVPLALIFAATAALGQATPTEFPEGANTFSADALTSAVASKVFTVNPAKGPNWRWQFNPNGYFFINVGNFAESGKWSTKDSTLCTESRQFKYSCSEVRAHGPDLYLKRESGEVIRMTLQ